MQSLTFGLEALLLQILSYSSFSHAQPSYLSNPLAPPTYPSYVGVWPHAPPPFVGYLHVSPSYATDSVVLPSYPHYLTVFSSYRLYSAFLLNSPRYSVFLPSSALAYALELRVIINNVASSSTSFVRLIVSSFLLSDLQSLAKCPDLPQLKHLPE